MVLNITVILILSNGTDVYFSLNCFVFNDQVINESATTVFNGSALCVSRAQLSTLSSTVNSLRSITTI